MPDSQQHTLQLTTELNCGGAMIAIAYVGALVPLSPTEPMLVAPLIVASLGMAHLLKWAENRDTDTPEDWRR